ncbi:hypothetical protein AAE478_001706 [Parahypoxylon ruwenzoriense]
MSLYRWSLPSRAIIREKSKESDSSQRSKFPSIHIGVPGPRRRANLSSAFAGFFERIEKDENQQDIPVGDATHITTEEPQPLMIRAENKPLPSKLKSVKCDPGIVQQDPHFYPTSETTGQISQDEAPKKSYPSFHLSERGRYAKSQTEPPSQSNELQTSLGRVRSTSSSYPSEGIRSPPDNCCSPQANTWSESFMSEIFRYGKYPSRESSSRSSVSTNIVSILDDRVGQCLMEELAAAGGVSDTDTRTTSVGYTPKPPLSEIASVASLQEQGDTQAIQITHCSRGNVLSMLNSQDSASLCLPQSYTRPSSSDDDITFRPSNTGSMDRLRPSTESRATYSTKKHQQGQTYNTMPASISLEQSREDSLAATSSKHHFVIPHKPGVHFKTANGSSTTLVRRIQKFKLRKWIKKVCLRSGVRFKHAMKPEITSKAPGKKTSRSIKSRRSKKQGRTDKPKKKSTKLSWNSWKAKKTEKKADVTDKKARGFIRLLKTKNSIQLPVQSRAVPDHRRAQSCPR